MKPTKSKMKPTSSSERGVCYFSHVPHGFFEKEMREFLTQFGTVTNLRIGKYVIPSRKLLVEFRTIVFEEFKEKCDDQNFLLLLLFAFLSHLLSFQSPWLSLFPFYAL